MSYDEVCSWLGLPPGPWPPDYYTLLGLEPGAADPARVEREVHERLVRLRSHQLSHPEEVTEAMNLLARAFTCLTDPAAKSAYDAALGSARGLLVAPLPGAAPANGKSGFLRAWLFGRGRLTSVAAAPDLRPPAVSEIWVTAPATPQAALPIEVSPFAWGESNGVAAPAPAPAPAVIPPSVPVDPVERIARCPLARQGLGTRRAVYRRLAQTRQLARAWSAAGKYLGHPDRRAKTGAEAVELSRLLAAVRRRLAGFPPLVGVAGQPGSYVVTLAGQARRVAVPTFRMLLPSQREMLARDWQDGLRLLTAHRRFLHQELRALRQAPWWSRAFRAADAAFADHPGWVLAALVAVAVVAAVWLGMAH
jgi:hypothetical protein